MFVGIEVLQIREKQLGSATTCVLNKHFFALNENLLFRPLGILKFEFPAAFKFQVILEERIANLRSVRGDRRQQNEVGMFWEGVKVCERVGTKI